MDLSAVLDFISNGVTGLGAWATVGVTLILTHITIASVTIFLHRHQAHRALELHAIPSHFFRFWLWLTTGQVTKEWAAIHRKHHAKCDTEEDPHSPVTKGIKKVFWEGAELYRAESKNKETMYLVETVEDVQKLEVNNPDQLAYVSQTTLSVDDTADIIDALKQRFPNIIEPKKGDICYATTNRQEAVKFMAPQVEVVIVVGSPNSSNSNRLREVAEKKGTPAYMVDNAAQINPEWLEGRLRVGVTAGASAPEVLVDAVISRLKELGAKSVRTLEGVEEAVTFPLPKGLDGRSA